MSDQKYGTDAIAQAELEAWPNPSPERDYVVRMECPEFTCLCPRSGFPDFATIVVDYIPSASVVELKSLKLYLNGFRDRGISHEAVTNQILEDLLAVLEPTYLRVTGEFKVRGNIKTVVTCEHRAEWFTGTTPRYTRPRYTGL